MLPLYAFSHPRQCELVPMELEKYKANYDLILLQAQIVDEALQALKEPAKFPGGPTGANSDLLNWMKMHIPYEIKNIQHKSIQIHIKSTYINTNL